MNRNLTAGILLAVMLVGTGFKVSVPTSIDASKSPSNEQPKTYIAITAKVEMLEPEPLDEQPALIVRSREVPVARPKLQSDLTQQYLAESSGLTKEQFALLLQDTSLQDLSDYFHQADQTYAVNGVFLMALAALESGWGTSRIAIDKNNYFGWNASDDNPYKNAKTFSTPQACIEYCAEQISRNYFQPEGAYYGAGTLEAMNIHYSASAEWKDKVADIMSRLYAKLKY